MDDNDVAGGSLRHMGKARGPRARGQSLSPLLYCTCGKDINSAVRGLGGSRLARMQAGAADVTDKFGADLVAREQQDKIVGNVEPSTCNRTQPFGNIGDQAIARQRAGFWRRCERRCSATTSTKTYADTCPRTSYYCGRAPTCGDSPEQPLKRTPSPAPIAAPLRRSLAFLALS